MTPTPHMHPFCRGQHPVPARLVGIATAGASTDSVVRDGTGFHAALRKGSAALANAILRDPPFADGNLPVAIALAGVFLELNGLRLAAPEAEVAAATRALSAQEMDRAAFAEWLRGACVSAERKRA